MVYQMILVPKWMKKENSTMELFFFSIVEELSVFGFVSDRKNSNLFQTALGSSV